MVGAERLSCFGVRMLSCLALWLVVSGLSLADVLAGLFAAGAAAWASVVLLPCASARPSALGWLRLAARVPVQALIAGVDVATRALSPALPLRPGFIAYETALPDGAAQNLFATLAAVQPGAVPIRTGARDVFDIHCLDTRLPVATALAREEAGLREALGLERNA